MPKVAKPLTAIEVKRLTGEGMHPVGTVAGLYLNITPANTASWILRTQYSGKRHEIGLGNYPEILLAVAISRAREIKDYIYKGNDPLAKRKESRATVQWTFKRCAEEYIKSFAPKWTSAKTRQAWENTLATYAYPVFGQKPVKDITQGDVLTVLKPEWICKHVTMTRVRQRIEKVLGWAAANGYRSKDNPAALKDNIEDMLPAEINKPKEHPALQTKDIQTFAQMVLAANGQGAKCLRFAMLTACRSANARGARWSEIDFENKEWFVEKQFMKRKVAHRTPLSSATIELLNTQPRHVGTDLIFPSNENKMLSNNTLAAVIKRMNTPVILFKDFDDRATVPHGLRAAFATWCQEHTNYPTELREHALAHNVGSTVTKSYERGDLFEKRRALMQDWADFCDATSTASNMTDIRAAR
jgi:integrase